MDLENLRSSIDEIDKNIMELFEKRMSVAREIAIYKHNNNLPIYNKEREDKVIAKNCEKLNNAELEKYYKDFLHSFMDISKEYQAEVIKGLSEE